MGIVQYQFTGYRTGPLVVKVVTMEKHEIEKTLDKNPEIIEAPIREEKEYPSLEVFLNFFRDVPRASN